MSGVKVEERKVGGGGTAAGAVAQIDLAPIPTGLAECRIDIKAVTAEQNDDEINITAKFAILNTTKEDWEYIEIRTLLLSASGQIVDETSDSEEQNIGAGKSAEFESSFSFSGLDSKALGSTPGAAHIVVQAMAYGRGEVRLGTIAIPDEAFTPVALKPVTVGSTLQLISGYLWKTQQPGDKECRVEVKMLVQNLTALHLPRAQFNANVLDKKGQKLDAAFINESVLPRGICMVSKSQYFKVKQLGSGATADVTLAAYWPLAVGMTQHQGIEISA